VKPEPNANNRDEPALLGPGRFSDTFGSLQ